MLRESKYDEDSGDDENPGTQKMMPLLLDTPETALLLDEAAALGNMEKLGTFILLQKANINSRYLYSNHTSLLATAVMNKRFKIVEWLLMLQNYVITTADIEEITDLIRELKRIKESDALNEENRAELKAGLAVLHALKEEIKEQHFNMISDKISISEIKAKINAAIAELSPPSATVRTTDNVVSAATITTATAVITTVATPSPLLYAFQNVNTAEIGKNTLFSSITNQEFDKFSALLKWLISQNAMFDINAADKDGKTLLHHASINPDDRFLKVLLENKANPNIGDTRHWTPVHYAAFTGKHFKVLIEDCVFTPIQWDLKTKKGETILQLAEKGQASGLNKFSTSDLDFISLKIPNTTESKNPNLH